MSVLVTPDGAGVERVEPVPVAKFEDWIVGDEKSSVARLTSLF
jgi:hypothetical protein